MNTTADFEHASMDYFSGYFSRASIISVLVLTMIPSPPSAQAQIEAKTIRYVKADAEGVNDGSDWANAWTDLQIALSESGDGVDLWVARGTYKPGASRSRTFQLVNNVSVRGGFAGVEDPNFDLDRRDFVANETTLSGEIGAVSTTDNTYHVVTSSGTDQTAILDGFTITAGHASGLTDLDQDKGGGLLNINGSPTIMNCLFLENEAGSWGGAVHNFCGQPTLIDTKFIRNRSTVSQGSRNKGGGMYSVCDFGGIASPTLINCAFISNIAGGGGGGSGGGYYDALQSFSSFVNCTFTANTAETSGGGIYGSPTLVNCILWRNRDLSGMDQSAQISGSAAVTYSCIQGGWSGTGNVSDDPLFAGSDGSVSSFGDLWLTAGSPCIDAGNNEGVPGGVSFDLDGYPRLIDDPETPDTGHPPSAEVIVDMGAHEYQIPCAYDSDCDDGDLCTTDICDEAVHRCVHQPIVCSDGIFCNGAERCLAGVCEVGTPPDCNDGVSCTVDSCDESAGRCDHASNDSLCNNGIYCDGVELCDLLDGCQSGSPVSCDDDVDCTVDSCDQGSDSCEHLIDDALCDDGLSCNGIEACDLLAGCLSGLAPDCDDGVPCTVDTCNESEDSCAHTPDDEVCDNGVFCDGAEICHPMDGCQPGSIIDCDDGVDCTTDSCDEALGACEHLTDNPFCDDGLFCNGLETCDPVSDCQTGEAPCPAEICDEDGDSCSGCTSDAECDDGVECTDDGCVAGTCSNTPDHIRCPADGTFCNGAELCDPVLGCRSMGNPCGDGELCNESAQRCDACQVDGDCDDGQPCTTDLCTDGSCSNTQVPGCGGGGGVPPGPSDACPDDPHKTEPGVCGCGVLDIDLDGDGFFDCLDACPEDSTKTAPGICGCGVPDTDTDNDGALDCEDDCPDDAAKTAPGECGCNQPDTDTDGDGVPDCIDGCPEDSAKTAPGLCGCRVSDDDRDGDGVVDCVDGCPDDTDKVEPGHCGCGIADEDLDFDAVSDCVDLCLGTEPGVQVDDDGCPAEPVAPRPVPDDDLDGVPDHIDLCPESSTDSDVDDEGCPIDDPSSRPLSPIAASRSCGVCGAFGMVNWMLLLGGWLGMRMGTNRSFSSKRNHIA